MNTHINTIALALERYRGGDYERALHAFRNVSPQDMLKEFGHSGQSCQQVLDVYREHALACDAALVWVESLRV